jgi:hypothetical protein
MKLLEDAISEQQKIFM